MERRYKLENLVREIQQIKNNEELRIIWKAMKTQWDINTRAKAKEFAIGEIVNCEFKTGVMLCRITKVNQKTINVEILDSDYAGAKAKVSFVYVTAVTDEEINLV